LGFFLRRDMVYGAQGPVVYVTTGRVDPKTHRMDFWIYNGNGWGESSLPETDAIPALVKRRYGDVLKAARVERARRTTPETRQARRDAEAANIARVAQMRVSAPYSGLWKDARGRVYTTSREERRAGIGV
jgi:hypothetical protein